MTDNLFWCLKCETLYADKCTCNRGITITEPEYYNPLLTELDTLRTALAECQRERDELKDDDVIIWIDNLPGARVLQDRVNIMVLEHNRFKVLDV